MPQQPITRADTLTSSIKKQIYFSDFLDSFATTPVGNELGRVVNESSVSQSIKNLVWTNLGERLFQPTIGGNVSKMMFEMNDTITEAAVVADIKNTLKYNEPRCNLISVTAIASDAHTLSITIIYSLINNPNPISIQFILERVR